MTEKGRIKFATNLNNAIEKSKMTKYQIAKRCGLAQSTITWWQQAKVSPKLENLGTVAKVIGVDVSDLIKGIKTEDLL